MSKSVARICKLECSRKLAKFPELPSLHEKKKLKMSLKCLNNLTIFNIISI